MQRFITNKYNVLKSLSVFLSTIYLSPPMIESFDKTIKELLLFKRFSNITNYLIGLM